MARILLSAFADEYSPDFATQLSALGRHGISYIEPRFIGEKNVADLTEFEARSIRAEMDAVGISAYSVGSPIGKISLDDPMEPHLQRAENCFRAARILGASRVRVFSFYIPEGRSRSECAPEVFSRMERLLDLADKYGVTLCHENEAGIFGESPESCLELLSAFGGRLRAVFDMGNFVLDGCEPYPFGYSLLRDYIDYFHIKDSLAAGAIVPPGLGEARIAEILAEYLSEGEDFVVTLEPHLETFSGLNALVGKSFENPYKFESPESAFDEAAERIKRIIADVSEL